MNDTLRYISSQFLQNGTEINQNLQHNTYILTLEIIFAIFCFIVLCPYLGLAFYCCTLYGGMVALHRLGYVVSVFRNGSVRLDVKETRSWINWWIILFGKIWHCLQTFSLNLANHAPAHEIIGLENIPNESTLFVIYHGPIPIDAYFFYSKLMRTHERMVCAVVNKNHLKLPLLAGVFKTIRGGAWTRKQCVEILNSGSDLCLLPGGKYESRVGDRKYKLEWDERKGFAEVALAAKVPIVPVFTRNIQEAFWTPWYAKPFTKGKFSDKKQFINLLCGGLPVKLVTFIGKPIRHNENTNFEDLAALTRKEMQLLIDRNQIIPGNKWRALMERIWRKHESENDDSDEEVEEFSREKEPMIKNNNSLLRDQEQV